MIDPFVARVGFHVFYQQPHMAHPEYGVIVSMSSMPKYIHVRFMFDSHAKACRPQDLHWPPDFCAIDQSNPPGQVFHGVERTR